MNPARDFIASQFLGNTYHFKCECIMNLDVTGTVKDYELSTEEIILLVEVNNRLIKIGLNHPNLYIEQL